MKHYQQRLRSCIGSILFCLMGVGFILHAFWDSLHVYATPSALSSLRVANVQVGGVVKEGSLSRHGSRTRFVLVDDDSAVQVDFTGTLPAMVREEHQALVIGHWDGSQISASRVYAKHDEYYRES